MNTHPEINLLLKCTCPEFAEVADADIAELLQQNINWDVLLDLTHMHGIEVPLASVLDRHTEAVPDTFRDKLQAQIHEKAEVNRALTAILFDLIPRFEEIGVRVIPFKGPEMTALAAGLEHRPFNDIDIFLNAPDARASIDMLFAQGYTMKYGGDWNEAEFRWSHGETVKEPGSGYEIDLHWDVVSNRAFGCKFSFEDMWDRHRVVQLAGRDLRCMSDEDLFLILVVHGCKHSWALIKWIRDLAVFAKIDSGIDWKAIKRRAVEIGAVRMVALSLNLVERLGVELPEEAKREFPADRTARSLVEQRLANPDAGTEKTEADPDRHKFYMKMRERPRDKIRYSIYLAKRLSDPTRWQVPLPAFFSLIFAMAWPFWLIAKTAKRALSTVRSALAKS
jgi:hypothetical protein